MRLAIDIETFSSADLKTGGVHKYVESPDFDILLFGYAYDEDEVQVIDLTQEKLPQSIIDDIYNPDVVKEAWNCAFERTCIGKYLGRYCEPSQWLDTMIVAATCGLPLSLDKCGEALGLEEDKAKMKEGAALIRYFSIPCKPTRTNGQRVRNMPSDAPDKWEVYKAYNKRDVETERTIWNRLCVYGGLEYNEHKFWCLDQKINDVGIKIDTQLARNAIELGDAYKNELIERAKIITGLDNPNSTKQVIDWLNEQEEVDVVSLNKKVVVDLVDQFKGDESIEFMKLRSEFSKSSTKKYDAAIACACADEHARGLFQFYGASTGRFAGRRLQLQNLSKNKIEDIDVARELLREHDFETFRVLYPNVQDLLSQLVRTVLIPEEGERFIVADFSAIEARVIAWIANERWRLDAFRNGADIYCESASKAFHKPVVKHGENGELRQIGKIMELALGYGGGVGAMKAFGAEKLGLSEDEMAEDVAAWREASPHVVALWHSVETAAKQALAKRSSAESTVGHVRFDYEGDALWMRLPSGRRIAYWKPEMGKDKWGRDSLTYMSMDQVKHKWTRTETFGGKLVENCIQATARDVLREAMLNLDKAGFSIRAHVHDEVILSVPNGVGSVEEVVALMCKGAKWTEGLPLNAEGYECSSYRKD